MTIVFDDNIARNKTMTSDDLNPQAREMAHESMVRNLAAQAEAIWPQERPLFDRYPLAAGAQVLDAGCGTGEISLRLAEAFPQVQVLGVDIIDSHLELARARSASLAPRVRFENRSIFGLGLADATFDLVVCRHVLQAIPHPDRVLAELARVTRRGGWLHLIAEDYLMINFEPRTLDPDDFWNAGPRRFGEAQGTDLRIGRKAYGLLRRLGLVDIAVDYVVVDPLRVPRETFAAIWVAWRDGYADAVSANTDVSREQFVAHFDDMIATLEDDSGYGVWHVPVVAARVP
jgi:SAM-dependent methyltransferase